MFRFFENLVDPFTDHSETNTPPRKLWPWLLSHARPFRTIFWAAGILSLIVAVIEIVLVAVLGQVVDWLSETPADAFWSTHGWALAGTAAFILVIRPLMQWLDIAVINNAMLPNVVALTRWRAHSHVMRQSIGWFENDFAGRIANRIMQAPSSAGEIAFQVFDAVTYALAYVIGAGVLLFAADPRLLIPLGLWFAAYLVLMRWTLRRVGPASKAASEARSTLTGRVVDSYTNIHSVKMFAHAGRELDYARDAMEGTVDTFRAEMRVYSTMDVALVVLNGVLIVGVVGWAIALWSTGAASIGIVAAATALTLRMNAMTGWIMWALSTLFQNMGIVEEGLETISQPVTLTDAPAAPALQVTTGEVRFDAVSHHYGRGAGGLDGVSLTVKPGEKIGLVGPSGAGKSTLVKLLLRFYDAEQGRILIDGQPVSAVTQDSLRQQIGMVQQESSLLHRSIRDNLLYGRVGASDAQMIEAARQAQAHDFIETLTDSEGRSGYDVLVGERGVKLSGGQRQRIALARVILKDAPILVLDEATSALDSEVEAAIQDTLSGMMEGKTVIAIAHRLSTIARMDRIVVLDKGRIVEDGPHEALLAKGGIYAGLWTHQSGGFLGEDA
ncbi:MAG: multidrug ABC transporter ATP-binding protein [Rhodobacterales bacterium]|nr:MAG: multidrug ABC transporter ATP-binding protein [Rhodobacterales bacterium]